MGDQAIMFTTFDPIGFFNIWLFIKLFALVLFLFYFILSLVIARQVDLMNQVLGTNIAPGIRLVVIIHAVAVGFLFFLALILI